MSNITIKCNYNEDLRRFTVINEPGFYDSVVEHVSRTFATNGTI